MIRWLSLPVRIGLALTCLLALAIPFSPAHTTPQKNIHAMPPNPTALEKLHQAGGSLASLAMRYSRGIDQPQHLSAPPTGSFNTLVVLVDFVDQVSQVNATFFDNLAFAAPGPGVNSVADYFDEISHSTLTLVTVNLPGSLGWNRAPWTYNGGGGYVNADGLPNTADDYGWGAFPHNLQGIVTHIIPAIDPLVDFSQYDNDGDGAVDSVSFVHAGPGAEITLSPNDIWSSAWNLSDSQGPGPLLTLDGVLVDGFAFDAEYMQTPGDQTIGMFCHELGHALFGLPDLYDPDNTSAGVGMWSLMGYGSWNGPNYDGSSPAWPDAWSRTVMGFEQPIEVTQNLYSYPVDPVEIYTNAVFKLWSPMLGAREYYLAENRQPVGYDAQLPGQGLLIWHVDEDKWNAWEANTYECTLFPQPGCSCPVWHPLVSLEQADGLYELENFNDYGDADDPYPFPYRQTPLPTNRDFAFGTNPESGSWYASNCPSDSCIAIRNISIFFPGPPDLLMADFQVICGSSQSCLNVLPERIDWAEAGTTANQIVSLQNCGPQQLFSFSASGEWPASFYNPATGQPITEMLLFSGGTAQVGVHVQVPESTGPGEWRSTLMTIDPNWYSGPNITTTLTTQIPTCVLLVDDDRMQPNVEGAYMASLLQNRFAFDYWDVTAWGNPSLDTLSSHPSTIWFTGAYPVDTLHVRDELALADYLNGGGELLLSSQDYLDDAFRTFFNRAYLGVGLYLPNVGANSVSGVPGTPMWENLGPYFLAPSSPGADRINPNPGSLPIFQNEAGLTDALGTDSGTWRSLFLAWPFESLAPPDASTVMAASMDWLDIVPRPVVSFTVSAPTVCTGDVVTFTNTTTGGTKWWWDFGDGWTSTMTDTTHTYAYPLTATVTLKGKNCCGYEIAAQPVTVLPAPQVGFSASSDTVRVGEVVTFTSQVTHTTHLLWDFGDGITSTLPNPAHIYTTPLTATVVLQGFSDCGMASFQAEIRVTAEQDFEFLYLPLTIKDPVGAGAMRREDWSLVVLPVVANALFLP